MSYALITHHITNTHMGMYCFLNNHNLANFEFYSQNIWYYPVIVQGMQHVLDTAIYKQNKIKKKGTTYTFLKTESWQPSTTNQ